MRNADQKAFLDAVVSSAKNTRLVTIPEESALWRAQKGCGCVDVGEGDEVDRICVPFEPERMKPLSDRAREGRVNPKGIPYLYAATEMETAIAEVRPWISSLVTVAELVIRRPLTVVNCTSNLAGSPLLYFHEPDETAKAAANWKAIDEAFSRPTARSDDLDDYVPTQILAEAFKQAEFDGVAYRSAFGSGHNLAIFDLDAVTVESPQLRRVASISIATEPEC